MPDEFEFRDLSHAEFFGINLQSAKFRDVDFTGVRMSSVRMVDVAIDAEIEGLVINGVDVTAYVNEHDEWLSLRSEIRPTTPDDLRRAWPKFITEWEGAIERARGLADGQVDASVDGEWSFTQTLRHLVFATDKWFTAPVLDYGFHPIGLPNTGSTDFPWPGVDSSRGATFEEALAAWRDRADRLRCYVDHVELDALGAEVTVLENGPHEVHDCIGVVFEEHFEHLRYALRDLDRLMGAA
jgi:hypothetical protein